MRFPRLLSHAFDSDSKSVSFGWALYLTSTACYLLNAPGFTAERWERLVLISTFLVAGKLAKEALLESRKETPNAPAPADKAP